MTSWTQPVEGVQGRDLLGQPGLQPADGEVLGRDEPVGVGAERLGEQPVVGVRQPVGQREGLRDVDADPARVGLLHDPADGGPLRLLGGEPGTSSGDQAGRNWPTG